LRDQFWDSCNILPINQTRNQRTQTRNQRTHPFSSSRSSLSLTWTPTGTTKDSPRPLPLSTEPFPPSPSTSLPEAADRPANRPSAGHTHHSSSSVNTEPLPHRNQQPILPPQTETTTSLIWLTPAASPTAAATTRRGDLNAAAPGHRFTAALCTLQRCPTAGHLKRRRRRCKQKKDQRWSWSEKEKTETDPKKKEKIKINWLGCFILLQVMKTLTAGREGKRRWSYDWPLIFQRFVRRRIGPRAANDMARGKTHRHCSCCSLAPQNWSRHCYGFLIGCFVILELFNVIFV